MKNTTDFFAWMRTKLGFPEDATVSEVQQKLIDDAPAAKTPDADKKPADTEGAKFAELNAKFDALAAEVEAKNARIAELEKEPAATHTAGPDEVEDSRPRAAADNKEMTELGQILRNSLRSISR